MAISEKMRGFAEKSSWIRKMFEEGARLKGQFGAENVFDFSLGNPDLPPPARFYDVLAQQAADRTPGVHGYMTNNGYQWVREALAQRVSVEQQVPVAAADMLMTCGAAGGLNVSLKALLNPGEEVVALAPYFVEYGFYVDNNGGVLKVVSTDDHFDLDFDAIDQAITEKTKAVIINSPNNPTGQVYSAEKLERLGALLDERGRHFGTTIYLLSDEPYRKIVFDGVTVPPVLAAYRNAIIVSSYSKDLSLPGERIGYLAVHPEIEEKAALLGAMNLATRILGFVNAPAMIQRVVAKLQEETVAIEIYDQRREKFCTVLDAAGYEYLRPKGGFYFFPKAPGGDDVTFCSLLQEEKILAVPGRGFGAPGYFRLVFCVSADIIERSGPAFARAMEKAKNAAG